MAKTTGAKVAPTAGLAADTPRGDVLLAIRRKVEWQTAKAASDPKHKPHMGLHVVWDGLNRYLRDYYDIDPIALITQMANEGVIVLRPWKGGAMVFLPEHAPKPKAPSVEELLGKK